MAGLTAGTGALADPCNARAAGFLDVLQSVAPKNRIVRLAERVQVG